MKDPVIDEEFLCELRAEFNRQHSHRNLKRNRFGNYAHAATAVLWKQHLRTALWMKESPRTKKVNSLIERGMLPAETFGDIA